MSATRWVIRRLPLRPVGLGRSTRAAVVAMVGVVAGATGVAGVAHQLTLAEQPVVPMVTVPSGAGYTPSMRAIIPAGLRDAEGADAAVEDGVGRGPVGPAGAYRGSIVRAPDAAVAAYQRAEAVINQAAECGLDWTVLAAVARVESNHGQGEDRGHQVTKKGRVRPAFVGAPLDGTGGRGELADTDLGELDGNRSWDAPVGALGLLPTRWSSVAVDADGNDRRDPQDLDDAALGAAVLLCAEITGGREASQDAAQEAEGLESAGGRSSRGPGGSMSGERPVRPAEVGGFEAQAADGLRTSTTAPEEPEGSVVSERQLLRAALREYHDGKRFVSTVLALRKRYARQAEELPAYEPPPGGVEVPDLPPLCDCDPPRTARDNNNGNKNGNGNDGGKRGPGGRKDGPRSPSPGGNSPQPGGGGGSGSPGSPSPTDPPTTGPTDPGTTPTDPGTTPTDPGTTPTEDPTSDPPTEDPTSEDPTPSESSSTSTTDSTTTP